MKKVTNLFGKKIINIQLVDEYIYVFYEDGTEEKLAYTVANYEKYSDLILKQNRNQYAKTNSDLDRNNILSIISYVSPALILPIGILIGGIPGAIVSVAVSLAIIKTFDTYTTKVLKQSFLENKMMINSSNFILTSLKAKKKNK